MQCLFETILWGRGRHPALVLTVYSQNRHMFQNTANMWYLFRITFFYSQTLFCIDYKHYTVQRIKVARFFSWQFLFRLKIASRNRPWEQERAPSQTSSLNVIYEVHYNAGDKQLKDTKGGGGLYFLRKQKGPWKHFSSKAARCVPSAHVSAPNLPLPQCHIFTTPAVSEPDMIFTPLFSTLHSHSKPVSCRHQTSSRHWTFLEVFLNCFLTAMFDIVFLEGSTSRKH